MSFNENLNEKVVPAVMKFVNMKGIIALKDGMLYTLPLNIVGSILLLIACFPLTAFTDFMANTFGASWNDPLFKAQGSTMNIMAIIGLIGMAYIYARNENVEPFSASCIALSTYLILNNNFVEYTPEGATEAVQVGGVIPMQWTGGQGMFTAIIVSISVAAIYSWFIHKGIRIKMPEGVPEGVVNSFSALIPATAIILGATVIYTVFKFGFHTSLPEMIYGFIQTPLQAASDSLGGAILISFFVPFLWFFGIHGGVTVGGMVGSLLMANTMDNAALQAAGTLDLAHGAHIVVQQFLDNFINLSGSGQTIGVVLFMLFFAKSAQFKELGKLAAPSGLFNINEPILFGIPVVMNPIMGVPFILVPVINSILLYMAIKVQILPPMGGQLPPWTTPPIISGFILGGWKYAVAQAVVLVVGFFIYLPFLKKIDTMNYEQELQAKNA